MVAPVNSPWTFGQKLGSAELTTIDARAAAAYTAVDPVVLADLRALTGMPNGTVRVVSPAVGYAHKGAYIYVQAGVGITPAEVAPWFVLPTDTVTNTGVWVAEGWFTLSGYLAGTAGTKLKKELVQNSMVSFRTVTVGTDITIGPAGVEDFGTTISSAEIEVGDLVYVHVNPVLHVVSGNIVTVDKIFNGTPSTLFPAFTFSWPQMFTPSFSYFHLVVVDSTSFVGAEIKNTGAGNVILKAGSTFTMQVIRP